MIGIYLITNLLNGKKYVGQSVDIKKRWNEHKYHDKSSLIHRAIAKYGIENFKFEVICECTKGELNELEKKYIQEQNSMHPHGYNLKTGGGQCVEYCEASKMKISESMKKRTGWHHTEETKRKIGDAHRGRKRPAESVEKMRRSLTGRHLSPETVEKLRIAFTGRKQTPEAIEKTRMANLGKKRGPLSEEHKRKISDALRGTKMGDSNPSKRPEVRAKLSEKAKGRKQSEETIRKLTEKRRNMSAETKAKMSASHKGKSMPKYPWRYPDGRIVYMPNNISARLLKEGRNIVRVTENVKK